MVKKTATESGVRNLSILVFLLVLLPALVLGILRNTNSRVEAAPIPPKLEKVVTGGSSDSSRVTASSVTAASSSLYLAAVSTKPYASVTSVSGLGLTWSRIKSQCAARSSTGTDLWMAVGSPTTSGSVTASLSRSPLNSIIAVSRFSAVDLTDPISDPLASNTRGINGACTGGVDTANYSQTFLTDRNSLVFGAVALRLRTHTPGSGISEVIEYGRGSDGDRAGLALVQAYKSSPVELRMAGTLNSEMDWSVVSVQVHGSPEASIPTPTPTPRPTIVPTQPPSTTITPTPRPVTPTPTTVVVTPVPTLPPLSPITGIWTSPSELASKPMTGEAWTAVKNAADSLAVSPSPDLDNQDDDTNVKVLAAAIVYARNGNVAYRSKVVSALQKIETFTPTGRSLAWARETGAYAMAADLISYRTTAFANKMRAMAETYKCSQMNETLLDMFKERPNNWGAHAFGSLTAIYRYLGDTAKLAEVRDYYVKGLTGPKPSQAVYGSLSWQCNESDPRIINPAGCIKTCNGVRINVDGIIPDDMRRGGSCSSSPGFTGYPWEGLQGYIMGARVLQRAGMPVWGSGDRALCRAASALQDGRFGSTWKATGDDQWQLVFLDNACGTNWSASYGTGKWGSGKNTGWAYVL